MVDSTYKSGSGPGRRIRRCENALNGWMTEELRKKIRSVEEHLLQPEVRNNPEELSELIADDFVEYGSSGTVYGKKDILKLLPSDPGPEMEIEEYHARPLSPQVVLINYKVYTRRRDNGPPTRSERSSIWRLTDGRWQIVFHKGTII